MPSVSVDQLIGKNYVVKKPTKIYTRAEDSPVNVIGTAKPGQSVGSVYSYIGGTQGRPLWLQFLTPANQPFYILYEVGQIDRAAMVDQGVKTTAQVTEEQNTDGKSETKDLIMKTLKYAGLGILGFLVFKTLVNKK